MAECADRLRRVSGIFVGAGSQLQRSGIDVLRVAQGLQRGDGVLGFVIHQLNGGEDLALARIIGMKSDGLLQRAGRVVEALEAHEAGGIGVERVNFRVQELLRFFKMRNRGCAISFAIFENGQHGVGSEVFRMQFKQMVKKRNCGLIAGLIVNLRSAFEGGNIVRGNLQRLLKGGEGVFAVALAGEGDALERPELGVVGELLEGGPGELNGFIEIPGAQGRADGLGGILRGL